jgi:hypothetical protein
VGVHLRHAGHVVARQQAARQIFADEDKCKVFLLLSRRLHAAHARQRMSFLLLKLIPAAVVSTERVEPFNYAK